MLCNKCGKNEAAIYYSESYNGVKRTYALCRECASQAEANSQGNTQGGGFGETDESSLLSEFFGDIFGTQARPRGRGAYDKRCPVCGATLDDIARTGKVGCAECYRTYSDELRGTIRRIHGSAEYRGRSPLSARSSSQSAPQNASQSVVTGEEKSQDNIKTDTQNGAQSDIAALQSQLDAAIREEYEQAAQLRDRIRAVRGKA